MKRLFVLFTSAFAAVAAQANCGMERMGMGHACPPMGGGYSGGFHTGFYFLLLVLGYWVLRHAEKETMKLLKNVGRTVAWVILIGSLAGLLCPLLHCRRGYAGRSGMTCPFSGGQQSSARPDDDDDDDKGEKPAPAAPEKKK